MEKFLLKGRRGVPGHPFGDIKLSQDEDGVLQSKGVKRAPNGVVHICKGGRDGVRGEIKVNGPDITRIGDHQVHQGRRMGGFVRDEVLSQQLEGLLEKVRGRRVVPGRFVDARQQKK